MTKVFKIFLGLFSKRARLQNQWEKAIDDFTACARQRDKDGTKKFLEKAREIDHELTANGW